jgi:hypothetical protein
MARVGVEQMNFTAPPAGMLSDQIDLPDHHLSLGLVHTEDQGLLIAAWDGARWRHLTADAAIRYAQQLEGDHQAAAFLPVTDALRALVDKISEIETSTMMRRVARRFAGPKTVGELIEMNVAGQA